MLVTVLVQQDGENKRCPKLSFFWLQGLRLENYLSELLYQGWRLEVQILSLVGEVILGINTKLRAGRLMIECRIWHGHFEQTHVRNRCIAAVPSTRSREDFRTKSLLQS